MYFLNKLLIMFVASVGSRAATGHADVMDNCTLSTIEDYRCDVHINQIYYSFEGLHSHLRGGKEKPS